jgi:hypothetical protein
VRLVLSLVLLACVLIEGCLYIFDPCVGCRPVGRSFYSRPTAPESLITNLQASYRMREIEHYSALLAPEFIFKYQPMDASDIGAFSWTRGQDSTATRALLTTTQVSDIRISLTYGARDSSVNLSLPIDSLKIRITTDLQVDQTDVTTWVVTDQQDLFFRKGRPENREDPTRWFIYEWEEKMAPPDTILPQGARSITWAGLKALYAG